MSFAPRPSRTGRIAYRRQKDDALWGFETLRITLEKNRQRTLVSHCEMELDGREVMRDSTLSIDAAYQPREAYVRICNHGERTGSGIYWLGDDMLQAHCDTDKKGRINSGLSIDRPLRGFGIHAVQGDAWMAAPFPFEQGPGSDWFSGENPLHSLDHLGATGPWIETSQSGLRYHQLEDVTVPAGTFACHKMELVGITNDHPPYYFWVSADGDFLFVKGTVDGYMASYFQLENLEGAPLQ